MWHSKNRAISNMKHQKQYYIYDKLPRNKNTNRQLTAGFHVFGLLPLFNTIGYNRFSIFSAVSTGDRSRIPKSGILCALAYQRRMHSHKLHIIQKVTMPKRDGADHRRCNFYFFIKLELERSLNSVFFNFLITSLHYYCFLLPENHGY